MKESICKFLSKNLAISVGYLIFLASFFLYSSVFSQSPLLKFKTDTSHTYSFIASADEKQKITNYFTEYAPGKEYTFYFSINITIDSKKKGNWMFQEHHISLNTDINAEGIKSKIFYRGFPINSVLIPSCMDCSIAMYSQNGDLLSIFEFSESKKNNEKNQSDKVIIPQGKFNKSNIFKIIKLDIYYNEFDKKNFMNYINYIDTYYKSDSVISEINKDLNIIEIDNNEMVKIYDIHLCETEDAINEINLKEYATGLNLKELDPISFIKKWDETSRLARKQRLLLNHKMATLDKAMFKKAKELLDIKDTTKAVDFLRKSIAVNAYNISANYYLALIYFKSGKIEESVRTLNLISNKTYPDSTMKARIAQLEKEVYTSFINKGKSYIHDENYHQAISLFEDAITFCNNTPVILCKETLNEYMSQAKQGVYNSFITVSKKALEKDIIYLAEIYISKASDYQKSNKSYIPKEANLIHLQKKLINAFVKRAYSMNESRNYDTSLVLLTKAFVLCDSFALNIYKDELEKAATIAKTGKLNDLLQKAIRYNKMGFYDKATLIAKEATDFCKNNAKEISSSFVCDSLLSLINTNQINLNENIAKNDLKSNNTMQDHKHLTATSEHQKKQAVRKNINTTSLSYEPGTNQIIKLLEKASVKVWGNEIRKALLIADSAIALQSFYNLKKDTIINSSINKLNLIIQKKQCYNLQESYNESYRKAYQSIKLKQFSTAVNYFDACIDTANKHHSCNISDSTAILSKARYMNASLYQNLMTEAKKALSNSDYQTSFTKYIEAETFFLHNNINDFSLEHINFTEYIQNCNHYNFIIFCSQLYLNQGKIQESLALLKLLREKNFDPNKTLQLQENIAKKLVEYEFNINPKQKAENAARKYLSTDKYYVVYNFSFLKQWKIQKKQTQ